MGLIDKAAGQAEQLARQGLEYVEQSGARVGRAQAISEAEGLLHDLGAWAYATAEGRDGRRGPEEVGRLTAELRDLEARHGRVDLSTGRSVKPEPEPAPARTAGPVSVPDEPHVPHPPPGEGHPVDDR